MCANNVPRSPRYLSFCMCDGEFGHSRVMIVGHLTISGATSVEDMLLKNDERNFSEYSNLRLPASVAIASGRSSLIITASNEDKLLHSLLQRAEKKEMKKQLRKNKNNMIVSSFPAFPRRVAAKGEV